MSEEELTTDQLIATLRDTHGDPDIGFYCGDMLDEAADRLEELCAEIEQLKNRTNEAYELMVAAVEIMSSEQLGRWAGVRAWMEDGDE
jgi:hypothetical protein